MQDSILHIHQQKEQMLDTARQLVGQYWDWFNEQNTNIAQNRKVGDTSHNVSSIAPVVEARKSGQGEVYYIVWKKHNPKFRSHMKKKIGSARNASIPIHKYSSRTIKSILKTHCTWDTEQAIKYETSFDNIRTALKAIHETEVKFRGALRKASKETPSTKTTLGENHE